MAAAIENFTTIIKRYRLDRDDSIFAYETAWEPNFGSQQARTQLDGQWSDWLTAKYKDIKLAEGAWNHKAPRDASGSITGVSTAQLAGDEPGALRMVADYRRFLDSWLNSTYGAATAAIKKIAPAQMVSFRMASAGFPADDQRGDLPYQLEGLTSAVDFLSPECYGRVGSPEGELGILFESAYARAVGPTLPVIWAEVGFTAWDPGAQQDDPGAIEFQGKYLDTFYRLAIQSGVDGIFYWWYPGGFRVGENSDFGIINPDGTDRPATVAIRKWGPLLLNAPDPAPPSAILEFDRNRHADGVHGVWMALKQRFEEIIKNGGRPALKKSD
jgi:Beta-galactosidase